MYLFQFLNLIRSDEIPTLIPHLFLQPFSKLLQNLNIKLLHLLGVLNIRLIMIIGTTLHLYSNNNQFYINLSLNISFYIDPPFSMFSMKGHKVSAVYKFIVKSVRYNLSILIPLRFQICRISIYNSEKPTAAGPRNNTLSSSKVPQYIRKVYASMGKIGRKQNNSSKPELAHKYAHMHKSSSSKCNRPLNDNSTLKPSRINLSKKEKNPPSIPSQSRKPLPSTRTCPSTWEECTLPLIKTLTLRRQTMPRLLGEPS